MNEKLDIATHRVTRVDKENQRFYTKGDANKDEDSAPVHFENVIGVPQFSIPYLGFVSDFVQNPPGTYITIALGLLLIVLIFLPDILGKGEKKDEKDEKKAEEKPEEKAEAAPGKEADQKPEDKPEE